MVEIKAHFALNGALNEPNIKYEGVTPQVDKMRSLFSVASSEQTLGSIDVLISTKARLFKAISAFKSSMSTVSGTEFKIASNPPDIVAIRVTTISLAKNFSTGIIVRQLAAPQIVVFRLIPKATSETALRHIGNPLKVMTTKTKQTLSIDGGNFTVKGFTQSLNSIPGLKASLLQTQNGFVIIIKTIPGTSNALQPRSVEAIQQMLRSSMQSGNRPLVAATHEIEAKDTLIQLRGQVQTYVTNKLENLVPGYVITARTLGQVNLHSAETVASFQERIAALLLEINTLIKHLASVAYSRERTAITPSSAERVMAQMLLNRLHKIVSQPMYGFTRAPISLAALGVEIAENGLIYFDKDRFKVMAEHDRDVVAAILGATDSQTTLPSEHDKAESIVLKRIKYLLVYDPFNKPVTATLSGSPLIVNYDHNGHPILLLRNETHEVCVFLSANEPITAGIAYGDSLLDKLNDFVTNLPAFNTPMTPAYVGLNGESKDLEHHTEQFNVAITAIFTKFHTTDGREQENAINNLPPEAANLLLYLLWIGVFISNIKRKIGKKHLNKKQHGWRRERTNPICS